MLKLFLNTAKINRNFIIIITYFLFYVLNVHISVVNVTYCLFLARTSLKKKFLISMEHFLGKWRLKKW